MNQPAECKTRINYSKTLQSRYVAHLDTIDVICKTLRRLQLSYAVTQGCHVRPKISFGPPLPIGHASYCEYFVITLNQEPDLEWLKGALNREFPKGMEVISIEHPWSDKKSGSAGEWVQYKLYFRSEETAGQARSYLLDPNSAFEVLRKGQKKSYVLGKAVQKAELTEQNGNWLLTVEFIQGLADMPSVSKIVTALAEHLGSSRDDFYLLERTALKEL
ncbi:MAG: TIGR03936 family radical SAM-associated protein [Candidatus Riflebacteria bacterium]|nr:TIGR03936 family radical SAM-associated protein [Candidatus Riflebacteria bacterium]